MKRNKTFYGYFFPILLLSAGLVVSFGSYIYFSTTNSVVERIADSRISLISQIRNTFERNIQTIEYAFNTYSTTRSFDNIINSPLTEHEFIDYQELNSQLRYIAIMSLEDAQYTLVSLNQNWSLSDGRVHRLCNR